METSESSAIPTTPLAESASSDTPSEAALTPAEPVIATPNRSFGAQLKALREEAGLTQRALYVLSTGDEDPKTGPVTAISHWEDGRRTPLPSQLQEIVRVLRDTGRISSAACWELVLAAAAEHHRYAGFLAVVQIMPRNTSIDRKWSMYESWAMTFPERG